MMSGSISVVAITHLFGHIIVTDLAFLELIREGAAAVFPGQQRKSNYRSGGHLS